MGFYKGYSTPTLLQVLSSRAVLRKWRRAKRKAAPSRFPCPGLSVRKKAFGGNIGKEESLSGENRGLNIHQDYFGGSVL